MEKPIDSEQFYINLKKKLEASDVWPNTYLYKFIYKTQDNQLDSLKDIFRSFKPEFRVIESAKGTYTSVSIELIMDSPELIIQKYKEVGENIKGVISL